jgi:hypothetical protein
MLADADKISEIHTRWHRQTRYFDEDGHPKTIPVSGPAPSYEALCVDCGLADEWRRLLKGSLRLGMCCRIGSSRLSCLSEITLFTGIPSLMLARMVLNVERFLKTSVFNARRGRKMSESLADRTAWINLSDEEFQHFANSTRPILHDFIESTDRRLIAGVAREVSQAQRRPPRRRAGVTAFVFRD